MLIKGMPLYLNCNYLAQTKLYMRKNGGGPEVRSVKEIEIKYNQTDNGGKNQDSGNHMKASLWKPMLHNVKTKTLH